MQAEVNIKTPEGIIQAPASKSYMQRALAISLLTRGKSVIRNLSSCDDVKAAYSMIGALGAIIEKSDNSFTVTGPGIPVPAGDIIYCGESGLASRLFIPLASLSDRKIIIEGRGSLLSRRMDDFSAPLSALGVDYSSSSGFLPVTVKGPLHGGRTIVNGKMSSQFLSGLLIALPATGDESIIEVNGLTSKPYVDITLDVMKMAGVLVSNIDYKEFHIKRGQAYNPFDYTVEGDWSGASVFLVMGAIRGGLTVTGLNPSSFQADRMIIDVIKKSGAEVKVTGNEIKVKSSSLRPFSVDVSDAPDLVPALAVLALACKGRSAICNIERLRVKESDRVMSISEMIRSLGGAVREEDNSLLIDGKGSLDGGAVDSYNDHRIVMAASAASVLCRTSVHIKGIESVNKSYPEFMDHMIRAGAIVTTK